MGEFQFQVGDDCWTEDGRKVELLSVTGDKSFFVAQKIQRESHDDFYEVRGEIFTTDKLFEHPPVEVVDAEIVAKRAELDAINEKIFASKTGIRDVEREAADRLKKLSKFMGLEHLEAFIEGKVQCFVVKDYHGYRIEGRDFLDYKEDRSVRPCGLKLLTLYGDSKGLLTWRLSAYRSESSSEVQVIPCLSEEEARAALLRMVTDDLGFAITDGRDGVLFGAISQAMKCGLPVPDDAKARYDAYVAKGRASSADHYRKQIADAQAKLDALLVETAP